MACRDEEAVLPFAEQVARRADAVREHQRQSGGGRFVDDDGPGLVPRQEREDVRIDVLLGEGVLREVAADSEAHTELVGKLGQPSSLAAAARDHEPQPLVPGLGDRAHEDVHSLVGHESRDAENDYLVVRALPSEPICPLDPGGDVDGVGERSNTLRSRTVCEQGITRRRPDGQDARRAAHEPGHDRAFDGPAPRRTPLEVVALDVQHVRHVSDPAPGERRLCGEGAPAGHDDDVGS